MKDAHAFTKEDLVFHATRGDTIAIREAAAEALYQRGRSDGGHQVADAVGKTLATPGEAVTP